MKFLVAVFIFIISCSSVEVIEVGHFRAKCFLSDGKVISEDIKSYKVDGIYFYGTREDGSEITMAINNCKKFDVYLKNLELEK